jgi:formylglycine-generating enzyme required for sulfatase activity
MKTMLFLLSVSISGLAQAQFSLMGHVFDSRTKVPLSFATVSVKGKSHGTVTATDGRFELFVPGNYAGDTLVVSYLGYAPYQKVISAVQPGQQICLDESYTMLEEVVISRTVMNVRKVEKDVRVVRGNLYAMHTEVTNAQYNLFLRSLEELGLAGSREKYDYDLSAYDDAAQAFFKRYVTPFRVREQHKDSVKVPHIGPHEWGDYPAVNVSHAGAEEYCKWLTDQYNGHTGRKKFKKVRFRLPTLQEWQIAALGYDRFQTWNLEDNMIDVIVSADSMEIQPGKGVRRSIRVGKDELYPWYGSYYYRRSVRNHMGCFLGNFRIGYVEKPCPANNPAFDGWSMMGRTASYFPNNIGLYDVVGNVAEMIDSEGTACGGSWDDIPEESTIHSVKSYAHPDATIGFRVFMEVVE